MPSFRVMSPAKAGSPISCFGRSYSQTPGLVLDVPDGDAELLFRNQWLVLGQSGPSSARPTTLTPGRFVAQHGDQFFDTTLGKVLSFDGATWRDPATGAVA